MVQSTIVAEWCAGRSAFDKPEGSAKKVNNRSLCLRCTRRHKLKVPAAAFKEKLTARRLASGASVNTETLASTPLKERIQQRQANAANAKTAAANEGAATELGGALLRWRSV